MAHLWVSPISAVDGVIAAILCTTIGKGHSLGRYHSRSPALGKIANLSICSLWGFLPDHLG